MSASQAVDVTISISKADEEVFERAYAEGAQKEAQARRTSRLRRAGSVVAVLALWTLVSYGNQVVQVVAPVLLPTPWLVLLAGVELARSGELMADIVASMGRVLSGFAIAVVVGILLGCVAGWSRLASDVVEPLVELLRPVPPLAFLPLFVIWLGLGETSKVTFIAFVAFFTVYLNTLDAVHGIDPILIRAARSLGARGPSMFVRVVLPAALPQIVTGVRLGFSMAFFALVAAELIAASSGLGYQILEARNFFRIDIMLFVALVIGVIGFVMNSLLRALEARALRWKPTEPGSY